MAGRVALCEKALAAMLDSYQRVSRLDLFQNLTVSERAIVVYLLHGFSENEIALRQKKAAGTVHAALGQSLSQAESQQPRPVYLVKFFRAIKRSGS